jgi:hypothetical protein
MQPMARSSAAKVMAAGGVIHLPVGDAVPGGNQSARRWRQESTQQHPPL